MSTSIITQAIEWALDKLKAKNGFIWLIIMIILCAIYAGVTFLVNTPVAGVTIPPEVQHIAQIVLPILAALVGSHTTSAQKRSALKRTINP